MPENRNFQLTKWPGITVPKFNPYILGPEECYLKSSLNICSVKFIDLYYKHPCAAGEKLSHGMSREHGLKVHPQN